MSTAVQSLSILPIKIISIISLFILSMLFGLIPYWLKRSLKNSGLYLSLCNSFSGGIFLGAALLHLFADSISQLQNVMAYPLAPLCLCGGFLFTFFLELFLHIYLDKHSNLSNSHSHHHQDQTRGRQHSINHNSFNENINESTPILDDSEKQSSSDSYECSPHHSSIYFQDITNDIGRGTSSRQNNLLPFILVIGLSVHSLFEGLGFGLQSTIPKMLDILIAVFSHKLLAAFALGVSTIIFGDNNNNQKERKSLLFKLLSILFIFSISSPIGACIGIFLVDYSKIGNSVPAILQGIASGTFLYIALVEIIPKEIRPDSDSVFLKCFLLLLGWSLMAVVAIWV